MLMAFALPVKVIPFKAPSSRCEATSKCHLPTHTRCCSRGNVNAVLGDEFKTGRVSAGLGSLVATNSAVEHTEGL